MLETGQKVKEEFGSQVMEVIGFEPDLIENVITQWEDLEGTIVTAKFMESQLVLVDESSEANP
jgi:hypothetical protein